jgi:hypothetical protein
MSEESKAIAVDMGDVIKAAKGLTGVDFGPAKEGRYPIPPVPKERVKEFFWATPSAAERKAPYVHVVWIDIDGVVHIETNPLGDTIDMIEWIYGSESLRELRKMNLEGIEKKGEVWTEFKKAFPPVANRLLNYEVDVSEISAKHKVPLGLLYYGSEYLASFRIEARIDSTMLSSLSAERAIHTAIAALEEAFYRIRAHQKRLADAWGHLPGRGP